MSRTHPYICEHGKTLDWGDFGPDPNNGLHGAHLCIECLGTDEEERMEERIDLLSDLLRQARDLLDHTGCRWHPNRRCPACDLETVIDEECPAGGGDDHD